MRSLGKSSLSLSELSPEPWRVLRPYRVSAKLPTHLNVVERIALETIPRIDAERLRAFVERVFERLGVPLEDARTTADVLIQADLRGVDSHGVARLQWYTTGLQNGSMEPKPQIRVVHETPVTATVHGGNGLGQVVGTWAMQRCVEKARNLGVGFATVRNSNHFGIAGYYAMRALPHQMIGISLTNSRPHVVPTFGRQVLLGTNPIAVAVPAGEERPFVLDMATSGIPLGKVEVASRKEVPLPPGLAVDSQGRPTTNPNDMLEGGGLLPLGGTRESGGHKGYGLAALVDILSGVLSGPAFGAAVLFPGTGEPALVGHFFGALRVDAFRSVNEFKADMDKMIRELKESPKAEGHDRIYVHGEIEYETEIERRRNGIPLHPKVLKTIREIGRSLGVEYDV